MYGCEWESFLPRTRGMRRRITPTPYSAMTSQRAIKCSMCDNQTEIPQIFFLHIVVHHSATKPFFTLCSVDSCNNRAFTVYSTFRRHWYLCHHNRGPNPPLQNPGIFSLIHLLRSYIAWHLITVIL
jgi:hypothetical protein